MTTRQTLITTAGIALLCTRAVYGQTGDKTVAFQYFVNSDALPGNMSYRIDGFGGKTVTGKPFSATEERQTVQVLGDGTRIDKKETDAYFRDAQGRTRIERDNGATVMISDPVTGFTAEMSTANRTAHKMMVQVRTNGAGGAQPNIVLMDKMKAEIASRSGTATAIAGPPMPATMVFAPEGHVTLRDGAGSAAEDLGVQIVNGVPAQGTRSTITIPAGQIGNDREIKVVSERWFSTDLQMLVKSRNSDPRFGETTYQLMNVIQGAQDAALFQIPADFSVNVPR